MIVSNYYGIPGATLNTETLEVFYNGELVGDYFGCHMILKLMARRDERKGK